MLNETINKMLLALAGKNKVEMVLKNEYDEATNTRLEASVTDGEYFLKFQVTKHSNIYNSVINVWYSKSILGATINKIIETDSTNKILNATGWKVDEDCKITRNYKLIENEVICTVKIISNDWDILDYESSPEQYSYEYATSIPYPSAEILTKHFLQMEWN